MQERWMQHREADGGGHTRGSIDSRRISKPVMWSCGVPGRPKTHRDVLGRTHQTASCCVPRRTKTSRDAKRRLETTQSAHGHPGAQGVPRRPKTPQDAPASRDVPGRPKTRRVPRLPKVSRDTLACQCLFNLQIQVQHISDQLIGS